MNHFSDISTPTFYDYYVNSTSNWNATTFLSDIFPPDLLEAEIPEPIRDAMRFVLRSRYSEKPYFQDVHLETKDGVVNVFQFEFDYENCHYLWQFLKSKNREVET